MEPHTLPPPADADPRKVIERLVSILGILGRGWRYIAVSVVIALTLGTIQIARSKTTYEAAARLLILHQGGHPLNVAGSQGVTGGDPFQSADGYSNPLATHIMVIRSPLILDRAVALSGLGGVSAATIMPGLTVKLPDAEARVLELNYKAGSRDEAVGVVESIIRSYSQFLRDNYQRNANEAITLIAKARDEMNGDLKKLEQEYLEFRQKSPINTGSGDGPTFVARRLDQWDQAINQATSRALLLKSQLKLARELADEGAGVGSVTNALNQLAGLGGEVKFAPETPDVGGDGALSFERLEAELNDVEFRRQMAEEMVAQLLSEPVTASFNDQEVVQAFYADPHVADLSVELRRTKTKYELGKRTTRLSSDPSIRNSAKRKLELEAEIGRLWRQLRPAIVAQLSGTNRDPTLVQMEAELRGLKAKETALRKQRDQVRGDRLYQLRHEYDQLAERPDSDQAKVKSINDQIARLEDSSKLSDEAATKPGQPQTRALLGAIERGLKSVEAMRAEIEGRFQNDLTESKKTEIDRLAESNLRNNLERQRKLFDSVVDQLKQAQLVSDYGSVTAQVLNPPVAIEKRASRAVTLLAALVLGLGLGSGLAFVTDLLDARVRSLSEIRKILDLRFLGMLPQLTREQMDSGLVPGLMSHTTPRSLLAESCKSIRTSLDVVRRNLNARVLLVTSAQSGEGKSTATSNLAICLAHAGRRVLLIDADLRRPNQHQIHGLRLSPGLTHVLKDMLPYQRVVQRTSVENLDLLASGPEVPNPAELLGSPRLTSLLDDLRQQYDVIIFDSSPLLAVTDASILASVVDGIALIVRVSVTRRHDLERTTELLATLGTPVLGTIVNGLVPEQFGAGFGYGYGYGYGAPRVPDGQGAAAHRAPAELTVSHNETPAFGTNGTADHSAIG